MSKFLSFTPRYHELTHPDTLVIWMPMYNPNRECVAEERQRIQAEGFNVETRPEKLEHLLQAARHTAEKRLNHSRAQSAYELKLALVTLLVVVGAFLFLSYVFGTLAARWLYPTWFATLSGLPATAVVYGGGAVVALPVLVAFARRLFRVETR